MWEGFRLAIVSSVHRHQVEILEVSVISDASPSVTTSVVGYVIYATGLSPKSNSGVTMHIGGGTSWKSGIGGGLPLKIQAPDVSYDYSTTLRHGMSHGV